MPFHESINPQISPSGGSAAFFGLPGADVPLLVRPQDAPAAQRRGISGLPCQYSNNSIGSHSKLTPYQRKNAFSINENLTFAVEKFGLEKIGFLTLTFPKNLTLKEAMRRFDSLASNILGDYFDCWVRVVEFTKGGRPHLHLIVVCRDDIRTGFDFENYLRMTRLSSRPERRRKHAVEIKALSRSLNPTPALRAIWTGLRRCLPDYQFGRSELIPIRKSGAALARYVGGYIRKSLDFRPLEAKGARLVAYSKDFPRKVVGHAWAFHCDGSETWRAKVALFAKIHRVRDLDHMKSRFGPRWSWWFKGIISSLNLVPSLAFGETPEHVGRKLARFMTGPDSDQFRLAVDSGVNMFALHLERPWLPELPGVPDLHPPRRLQHVFDFHLSSWHMTADQIAERSSSDRRRVSDLRDSGRVFFTHEMLSAARERLFHVPPATPAAVRAANYFRTRFSHLTPCPS